MGIGREVSSSTANVISGRSTIALDSAPLSRVEACRILDFGGGAFLPLRARASGPISPEVGKRGKSYEGECMLVGWGIFALLRPLGDMFELTTAYRGQILK